MKIETCPVCESPIEYIELTTLPPVPVKQCPSCGWRWEGKPEKIEYAPIEEETTMMIEDLEKALQYFVIAVPESEEQAKAYFWARKALTTLRSMQKTTKPGWISVKERLPDDEKDGETVLAIVSGKPHKNITLCHALMTAGYFPGEGWVVNEYPEWENPTITHWMPLPEPPEEE